jgi:hypothetical protein
MVKVEILPLLQETVIHPPRIQMKIWVILAKGPGGRNFLFNFLQYFQTPDLA